MATELVNLLNRAAAALETPDDLTEEDKAYLIEDLVVMAAHLAKIAHLSKMVMEGQS